MSQFDPENLDYASEHRDELQQDDSDGSPLKPTRAGPGFILILAAVCCVLLTLFMMFILRIF
jgi:hypothetical protein